MLGKETNLDQNAWSVFYNEVASVIPQVANELDELDLNDEVNLQSWVQADLLPILDGTSQWMSAVCALEREGNTQAGDLRKRLEEVLYGDFNEVFAINEWFQVEKFVLFEEEFDGQIHQAVGAEDEEEQYVNKIIAVTNVGLLNISLAWTT